MSLHGEPLFEGLNYKDLFGKELIVDKVLSTAPPKPVRRL